MNLKKVKTTGKTNFQQELDKWFKSRGIISDLRSHLRHLMVTALQNADLTPKSWDESSPKVQALNMLVAEYLFRKKCHYTLSVFASEVPAVSGFSAAAGKKSDSSQFDECLRRSGNGFQVTLYQSASNRALLLEAIVHCKWYDIESPIEMFLRELLFI